MVFTPINTDAPIYHWPRATVGLIAVSGLAFLLTASGSLGTFEDVVVRYGLSHGAGLKPLQWVTSNFLHAGPVHLVGNMLFLWGFGLVVEGKIGWRAFLAVYLILGGAECAIEQASFGGITGSSFGASAVIFGLMAIALVWAPKNDLVIGYWLPAIGVGAFDLSILSFSMIVVASQGLLLWWVASGSDVLLSSPLLHLLGVAVGFVVGSVMWQRGWVDCEGWDLFSVLSGKRPSATPSDAYIPVVERPVEDRSDAKAQQQRPSRRRPADPQRGAARRKAKCISRIRSLLDRSRPADAYTVLREAQHVLDEWTLPRADHVRLAETLQLADHWNEAVSMWEDYVQDHPDDADPIRIEAAEIMVRRQRRPHAAARMLEAVAGHALHPDLESRREAVEREARELIESGAIELEERSRK